jgi:hypothetical protein
MIARPISVTDLRWRHHMISQRLQQPFPLQVGAHVHALVFIHIQQSNGCLASQRQIRQVVAALVLAGSYMFDVKSEIWGRRLRETTIFTTLLRSLSNEISRICVHLRKAMGAEELPSFTLQKRNHVERGAEFLVFRLLFARQCAFVCPISKFFESVLSRLIRAQGNNSFGCLRSKAGDKWIQHVFQYFGSAHKLPKKLSIALRASNKMN